MADWPDCWPEMPTTCDCGNVFDFPDGKPCHHRDCHGRVYCPKCATHTEDGWRCKDHMPKAKRARYWVLRNLNGLYFREMREIGPRNTERRGKAARFPSRRKAWQSPAYSSSLETYGAEAVR